MKTNSRKLISTLLTLAMLVSLITVMPLTASAAAPVIDTSISNITQTTALYSLNFTTDSAGTRYLALYIGAGSKNAAEVKAHVGAVYSSAISFDSTDTRAYGTLGSGGSPALNPGTQYTLYYVLTNASGDSAVASATFTTLTVAGAPVIGTSISNITQTTALYSLNFTTDSAGTRYLALYTGAGYRTAAEVKAHVGAVYSSAISFDSTDTSAYGTLGAGGSPALNPGTQYTLYYVLTNASGESAVASATFTTLPLAGAPLIGAPAISGITQTSANYSLPFTPNSSGSGYIAVYTGSGYKNAAEVMAHVGAVGYEYRNFLGTSTNITGSLGGGGGGSLPLSPGTQYTAYFVLTNSGGDSAVASATFTTLAGAPGLSNLAASAITSSGAQVNFNLNTGGTTTNVYRALYTGGAVTRTAAVVKAAAGAVQSGSQLLAANDAYTVDFTSLSPNTQYTAYLVATNNVGDSAVATVTFTTLSPAVPPVIGAPTIHNITETSATYECSFTTNAAGTAYIAVFAGTGNKTAAEVKAHVGAVYSTTSSFGSTGTALSGGIGYGGQPLSPGTQYTAYFVLSNPGGDSAVASATFTTSGSGPGAPAIGSLTIYYITQTDAAYSLNFTTDSAGTLYIAVYSGAGGKTAAEVKAHVDAVYYSSSSFDSTRRNFSGGLGGGALPFNPGTQYTAYFVLSNAGGDSIVSETFTTLSAVGKQGDVNGDGKVDATDLSMLISDFGKNGVFASDINGDGKVDATDLSILISNFGK